MSVAESVNKRSPLKMQPNASFIIDEINDGDQEHLTPHALHNKRFTQKYLKSVFPSGFGVQNVRIGGDLQKDKHLIQNKKLMPKVRRSPSVSIMSQGTPAVGYFDERSVLSLATEVTAQTARSVLTAPAVPSIMDMNKSLATNVTTNKSVHTNLKLADSRTVKAPQHIKGTTGTKAPAASFTDAFKGAGYPNFNMGSMDDSLLEEDRDGHTDKNAPDDYADVAGPYFTDLAQQELPQPIVSIKAPGSPDSPGQGRPDTTAALLKEVVVQMHGLAVPLTDDDVSFSLTSLASSHTRGSGREPPVTNRDLTTRPQILRQKPTGIDLLKDYMIRARIPNIRTHNSAMSMPALLPALHSSVRLATGTGGHENSSPVHGVPPRGAFGLFTPSASHVEAASHARAAQGGWELGAAIAGAAASRAGYGPVVQLPATHNEGSVSPPPHTPTGLTTNKHNASGYLISYDQWIDDATRHSPISALKTPVSASGDIVIKTNSSMEGGMRVEVKRSSHASKRPASADEEHAIGLSYQTYPDSIHVYMYSFQQVMCAHSVTDMRPQYEFEMSRDMTLDQLSQTVVNKAAQMNASEIRFDEKIVAPVIFVYSGKVWRALEKPLEWSKCKLQSVSFLEKRRPLRLMYSMHLNEDLDEAFLYENKTTLAELRDFEPLGYEAPESSAGFGLRQIQVDGSPAASRIRKRDESPTSTKERAHTAPSGSRNFVHDGSPFDRSDVASVRNSRPQSPTVSRSSNRAVAQVTSAGGSAVSRVPKARPVSPDHAKTKFQLSKTNHKPGVFTPSPLGAGENGPRKLLTTEELNDMTGMLLGEPVVPPPALRTSQFPPPTKADAEKLRSLEATRENNNAEYGFNPDNDDGSVHSMTSFRTSGSQRDPTRTTTLTLVDMKLMSKYGSPPKPTFGHKQRSRAQSPDDSRFGGKRASTMQFTLPRKTMPTQKSKSLATLLLTHTPSNNGLDSPSSSSTVMSLNKVRDIQVTKNILANMSADKQNRLCNELEGRLLLTKW